MRLKMKFAPLATAVALSFSVALPAVAQEVPTDLPEIKAEDVSIGQVVSFVNAMIAAERVRQEYITKIDAAESEEEIKALVAEADQQGMAAVDKVAGITTAEYMAIAKAAQESEELSQRIGTRLAELRSSQKRQILTQPKAQEEAPAVE